MQVRELCLGVGSWDAAAACYAVHCFNAQVIQEKTGSSPGELLLPSLGSHTLLWVVLNAAPSSSGTFLPMLCPAVGRRILARTG